MDIFKSLLWYTYKEDRIKWYKLTVEQVQEIISLNKNKELGLSLEEYEADLIEEKEVKVITYENVVGQDSLTRFDVPKRKNKNKNKNRNKSKSTANQPVTVQNKQETVQKQQNSNNNKHKKRRPQKRSPNNTKDE